MWKVGFQPLVILKLSLNSDFIVFEEYTKKIIMGHKYTNMNLNKGMVTPLQLGVVIALCIVGGLVYFLSATPMSDSTKVVTEPPSQLNVESSEALLIGTWQSIDDDKSVVVFAEGGIVTDIYDGQEMSSGSWELSMESVSGESGEDVLLLTEVIDAEVYNYSVWEVSLTNLTLNYRARGNTLTYERIAETESVPASEANYVNTEYGFTLDYPADWEVQEALKPQQVRALHEINVWQSEYDSWRAALTVQIFENIGGLAVGDWWEAWLVEEDKKESDCRAEYGEESPCLFLRGLVEETAVTKIVGEEAVAVKLFQFDHTKECTYVAKADYVYGLCAAGSNPNDPNEVVNLKTTNKIRDSFKF